jgi:hypothetical protein
MDARQRLNPGELVDTCDVMIAGGGPAGSACAWKLRAAGADVLVVDKATFPRDKVCAGWITPQVIDSLQIDPDEYRAGRTFQPITAFRVGLIGAADTVDPPIAVPSAGIRHCRFDQYCCGGRRPPPLGADHDRVAPAWIVNGLSRPPYRRASGRLSVARILNRQPDRLPLVTAHGGVRARSTQRFVVYHLPPIGRSCARSRPADCRWCFRKRDYLASAGRQGACLPRRAPGSSALKANK